MGFFDKKPIGQNMLPKKPTLPKGSEPLKKINIGPKKIDLVKDSWMKGKSEIDTVTLGGYFKNPAVRSDLRRRLKMPQNSSKEQLDKEINSMLKMIPNTFGPGLIRESEIKSREAQRGNYWGPIHDAKEKSKGGFTYEEKLAILRDKAKRDFIKKKFKK
jgi:hypothetical protein